MADSTITPEEALDEEDISLVGHQPYHITHDIISVTESIEPLCVPRKISSTSLGQLETLPLELLQAIFAMLDFNTLLLRIARTCLRSAEIVASLPEYRDLVQFAPQALIALSRTKLLRYYPAATIHVALVSSACVSCGRYGSFLFLLTCQRCCFNCLRKNHDLWAISVFQAQSCFGVSVAGLETIPIMQSIPGKYHANYYLGIERIRLVSVAATKKLAQAGKSADQCIVREDLIGMLGSSVEDDRFSRFIQWPALSPPRPAFWKRLPEVPGQGDMFCGMAVIKFPSVDANKRIEHGFWCRGCVSPLRDQSWWTPTSVHFAPMFLEGAGWKHRYDKIEDFARSKSEFVEHIKQCPGAQGLLQKAKGK